MSKAARARSFDSLPRCTIGLADPAHPVAVKRSGGSGGRMKLREPARAAGRGAAGAAAPVPLAPQIVPEAAAGSGGLTGLSAAPASGRGAGSADGAGAPAVPQFPLSWVTMFGFAVGPAFVTSTERVQPPLLV